MSQISTWSIPKSSDEHFLQTQRVVEATGAVLTRTSTSETVYDPFQTNNTKPAPPTVGIDQQSTSVLILKKGGEYVLIVDGVQLSEDERGEYWLPRFRDIPKTEDTKRTVGPMCIGLRIEDGEAAPRSATINLKQRIVDGGTVLLQPVDVFQKAEEIKPHRTHDTTCAFNLLPYPSTIVKPPTITILDMQERRRWELKRRKWNNSRTWDVIQAVGSAVGLLSEVKSESSNPTQVLYQWFTMGTGTASSTMWKLALFNASPAIATMVSISRTVLGFPFRRFDATEPPPIRMKTYQFTANQLVSALDKIAKTNPETGKVEGVPSSLSPHQFGIEGYKPEAALLEYLLFGNSSTLDASTSDIADPEEDKDKPGFIWSTMTDPFPSFLKWNTKSLTGNILNPATLNLSICYQTRTDYSVHIEILDDTLPEKSKTFVLKPLIHNAVDAGLIYNQIEYQHKRVEDASKRVIEMLDKLRTFGIGNTWMHDRMYVSTGNSMFGVGIMQAIYEQMKTTGQLASAADAETMSRWKSLQSKAAAGKGPPLVFSLKNFKKRLNRILNGIGVEIDPREDISKKRRKGVVRSAGVLSIYGLTPDQYSQNLEERKELYRKTIGSSKDASIVYEKMPEFWRYVDTYFPLGPTYDYRLSNFLVPVATVSKTVPQLVQRLPQVGIPNAKRLSIFGNVSLIPTRALPDDATSERKSAKSTVDATRQCWKNAAETYAKLNWVVERETLYGNMSNAFHFVIHYDIKTQMTVQRLNESPRYKPIRETYTNPLILTGCQPSRVSDFEFLYEQANAVQPTKNASKGDARMLRDLRLDAKRINLLAAHVYASISSTRALAAANASQEKSELGITADKISNVIQLLYGSSSKARGSISEYDILFSCFPEGREVVRALFHVYAWNNMQSRLASSTRDSSLVHDRPLTGFEKSEITIFARSLYKLASSTNPVLLSNIAVTPFQCMWFSGNPFINRLQTTNKRYIGKTGVQIQYEEAMQSWLRVRQMTSVDDSIAKSARAVALACIVANRPVLNLASKAFSAGGMGDASYPQDKVEYPISNTMSVQVLMHLRSRAHNLMRRNTLEQSFLSMDLNATDNASVIRLDFHVPTGLPVATNGPDIKKSLSFTSNLEDVAVDPLRLLQMLSDKNQLFTSCSNGCSIRATTFAENGQENGRGKHIHPHKVQLMIQKDTRHMECKFYMSKLARFEMDMLMKAASSETVETTGLVKLSPLEVLKHADLSGTWYLHNPIHSLMFNSDRVCQIMTIVEVQDVGTDPVVFDLRSKGMNGSAQDVGTDPAAFDLTTAGFDSVQDVVLACVACVVGESMAVTQLGCMLRHPIRIQHSLTNQNDLIVLESSMQRLGKMMAALQGKRTPLSEVCLSVASCLFA